MGPVPGLGARVSASLAASLLDKSGLPSISPFHQQPRVHSLGNFVDKTSSTSEKGAARPYREVKPYFDDLAPDR